MGMTSRGYPTPDGVDAFDPDGDMTTLAVAIDADVDTLPRFRTGGLGGTLTTGGTGTRVITFDTPFPTACDAVVVQNYYQDGNVVFRVTGHTETGFTIWSYSAGSSSLRASVPFTYLAIGH